MVNPELPPPTGYNPRTMCLAAPARVISISDNTATVDYGGVETQCRLETLTEEVAVGDYVLIHTGFAIRRLSPEDGEETLKLFDELAKSLEAEQSVTAEGAEVDPGSAVGEAASSAQSEAPPKPEPNAASSAQAEASPKPYRNAAHSEVGEQETP